MAKVTQLKIELEQEEDGRWIGEVPTLPGVMAYGQTKAAALAAVQALALRAMADRLEHGEAVPEKLGSTANGSCRNERDVQKLLRHRLVMFETIGHCTKSQNLDSRKRSSLRLPIGHHAGQCRYFANPAAIFLLFQLDLELGNLCHGHPLHRSTKARLSPTTRKIK